MTASGKITAIVQEKGFGFIRSPDVDRDVFVHRTAIDRAIPFDDTLVGQTVSFEWQESDKGPRATNMWISEPAPQEVQS
ncbi:MAG TPA: cold shock domain-containing protein [Planctomycetaceae bacterium]|jgi:cold shock CspA family protein